MEQRLIIEQFDPDFPKPGGIDTCIRGLVRYCPPNIQLRIAGVDAIGNKALGKWTECEIGGRRVEFMPVARLDPGDIRKKRPHSAWVALGIRKYRPAPDTDTVNTHRLNLGFAALRLYPKADHIQYLHHRGADELGTGSASLFRYAPAGYRRLEQYVVPRTADTVVFNRIGAERLQESFPQVRFSPTWYDPAEFFPAAHEPPIRSKIIWAGRIEPQKNPELAIALMGTLPERFTLTVAGSGSLDSTVRRLTEQSPAAGRISLVGAIDKAEMGAVMRQHHVLLMTSYSEGFPYSVIEGLASGLPVVTTPGGEPNGLVRTGINGARVAEYRPELFGAAMEIAARVSSEGARDSVASLSAEIVVPDVMRR